MSYKPETLYTRTIAESGLFRIEAVGLRFHNGTEVEFERVRPGNGGGAVLVVPITDDDHVLLIREYAAATERYELGLPKGAVEPSEDPLVTANRELQEEVGYAADSVELLRELTIAPGYVQHTTHVVLASNLRHSPMPGDEPEPLEVLRWPLSDIDGLLARTDFTEARSIAALFMARERLNRTMHQEAN